MTRLKCWRKDRKFHKLDKDTSVDSWIKKSDDRWIKSVNIRPGFTTPKRKTSKPSIYWVEDFLLFKGSDKKLSSAGFDTIKTAKTESEARKIAEEYMKKHDVC